MEDLATKIRRSMVEFFSGATTEDIREALKQAGYEEYTGIDPAKLKINPAPTPIDFQKLTDDEIEWEQLNSEMIRKLHQQQRFCPPTETLIQAEHSPECRRHISNCPECREYIGQDQATRSAWQKLGEKILECFGSEPSENPAPRTGQVWYLDTRLEGWDEQDRYCRAPMVVIIGSERSCRRFTVAQIYGEESLMGPQDVWLDDRFGFAESWNIYRVRPEDLDRYCGRVSERKIRKIRAEAKDIHSFVTMNDYLPEFRVLETDLGNFFINRINL